MARQRGIEVDPLVLPVIGGPLASLAREGPAVEAPGALLAGSASPGSHGTQGSPGAQGMTLHLPLAVAALGYLLAIALTLAIRGDARGHHRGGQQAAELSGQAHDFPFYARGQNSFPGLLRAEGLLQGFLEGRLQTAPVRIPSPSRRHRPLCLEIINGGGYGSVVCPVSLPPRFRPPPVTPRAAAGRPDAARPGCPASSRPGRRMRPGRPASRKPGPPATT
jgi:hypothetical protein